MSDFKEENEKILGIIIGIAFVIWIITLVVWIIIFIIRAFILLMFYLITSFVPRILTTVLALGIGIFIYLFIPGFLLYFSVKLFSKFNREKYYSPRIYKLIRFMPILLIITGLSLGWLTKDTILRYREKLSFDKTAYGENSSKIGYGVKSYLKPSLNKGLKDIKRG